MKEERYKELMAQVGMPDSRSLLQVLKQAVMEATLEERLRMESECRWCGHANHHDVQYGCTEDGCECLGSHNRAEKEEACIKLCDYCEEPSVINAHGMHLCYPCAIHIANVEHERAAK